jgi:hypothetical protein
VQEVHPHTTMEVNMQNAHFELSHPLSARNQQSAIRNPQFPQEEI